MTMTFTPGEINIICTDTAVSLAFYRDILGFGVTTDDEGFYHLTFGGRYYLLLAIAQSSPEAAVYGSIPQFSMDLITADIEAAYHYFQEKGVLFGMEWKPGSAMFVIRDPDGLPWEVVQSE